MASPPQTASINTSSSTIAANPQGPSSSVSPPVEASPPGAPAPTGQSSSSVLPSPASGVSSSVAPAPTGESSSSVLSPPTPGVSSSVPAGIPGDPTRTIQSTADYGSGATSEPTSSNTSTSGLATSSTVTQYATVTVTALPHSGANESGLIAAVSVLGALLLAAIIALGIFLFRSSRRSKDRDERSPSKEISNSAAKASSVEDDMLALRQAIKDRDTIIREAQAALLKQARPYGDPSLGDAKIRDMCSGISISIRDWVVTYYKDVQLYTASNVDLLEALRGAVPDYGELIKEPKTGFLVLRALVAKVLAEAFDDDEFIGSTAYSELKSAMAHKIPPSELIEWIPMTVALLDRLPDCQNNRNAAIKSATQRIDSIISGFAGSKHSQRRLDHLKDSVASAANLAVVLARQPVSYTFAHEQGDMLFNPDIMEDALQTSHGRSLKGRRIRGVVFPALFKRSTQKSGEKDLCIRKAEVIL